MGRGLVQSEAASVISPALEKAKSSDWQRKPKVITKEHNTGLKAGGGGGDTQCRNKPVLRVQSWWCETRTPQVSSSGRRNLN